MWEAYQAQEKRQVAATDACYEAQHAAELAYPEPAACLWQRIDGEPRRYWHGGIRPASRDKIEDFAASQIRLSEPRHHANIIAARDKRLAALEAWEAECRAVDAQFNLPALDAAREAEEERYVALEQAIIDKPATGMLGIAVKLALWARTELTSSLECAGGEDNEEGQQWLAGPVVAAWEDALRLAGLPKRMGMERKVTDHGYLHQELALARSEPKLRFHHVDTDAMEPTYIIGDWLIFLSVDDYLYPAVYIIDALGSPVAYRFDSTGDMRGTLVLLRDNKLYGKGEDVTRDWLREHVPGLVVGHVRLPTHILRGGPG